MVNKFLTIGFIAVFILLFSSLSPSQTDSLILFVDDFESLTAGQQLVCQDSINWDTWNSIPCDPIEDPFVSTSTAYSGSQSVWIQQNKDLIKPIPDYTTGKYSISFRLYIPSGYTASWGQLASFVSPTSTEWGFYAGFDLSGNGIIYAGGWASAQFNFTYDTWMHNELIVDLNTDLAEYFFEGNLVYSWQWTLGSAGDTIPRQLSVTDILGSIYPNTGPSEWYIDDYQLEYFPNIINVPSDYSTIQEAIDVSMNGDLILVEDGTYYENINYRGKAITVASDFIMDGDTNHINNTIIDGSQPVNPDSGSVVTFSSSEDTTSILCGFTITGGTGTFVPANPTTGSPDSWIGGGIFIGPNSGASILQNHIEMNSISKNTFMAGGGIYSGQPGDDSYSIIEYNIIRNNSISGGFSSIIICGGGICMGGSGRIVNNEISNNICESSISGVPTVGGGVRFWVLDGSQDTTHCLLKDNLINNNKSKSLNTGAYAGGINSSGCRLTMTGNTIKDNVTESNVESYGSGMHTGGLQIGVSTIDKNEFIGNYSEGNGISYGGALYIRNSIVEVTNNIIVNNQSNNGGGLYLDYNTSATIINNTIVSNEAISNGGGIYLDQSTLLLINSILWENSGVVGSQIINSNGIIYVRYSDVEGGFAGEGNIDANPIFEDAVNGDYRLQVTSPCIQTAIDSIEINGVWYYCPHDDIEGNPRPNPAGTMPDMGAYEYQFLVGVEENETGQPTKYALYQNFPNPFNPTTTIQYSIKERTTVKLVLYDILGREVEVIINEEQDAGYYKVNFNAKNLASGIYFYRLKAGSFVETKKMLLIK